MAFASQLRRKGRPLITVAKGMVAATFLGACRFGGSGAPINNPSNGDGAGSQSKSSSNDTGAETKAGTAGGGTTGGGGSGG